MRHSIEILNRIELKRIEKLELSEIGKKKRMYWPRWYTDPIIPLRLNPEYCLSSSLNPFRRGFKIKEHRNKGYFIYEQN